MLKQRPACHAPCGPRQLISVIALGGVSEFELLSYTASVARGLEAPLAAAIIASAADRGISIPDAGPVGEKTGTGVAATVNGHTVVVGNALFFAKLGLSLDHLCDWPDRMRRHGQQVVFVAIDGRTVGLLGITDSTF